ncbi:MAG: PadR family transcriptional regulator [Flavobacteriales bacterium]
MYSRELLKGTLSVIILKLLAENGRMYGYEMFTRVKSMSDEKIVLKDGSLYPALAKLTKQGFLTVEEEMVGNRKRKYYTLTKEGVEAKATHMAEVKDFISTINRVLFPKFESV